VDAQRVYVPLSSEIVIALSLADGSVAWQTPVPGAGMPEVWGDRVFVTGRDFVVALDARSGATVWQHPLADPTTAPARSGDLLFVGAGSALVALTVAEGTRRWTAPMDAPLAHRPAPGGERAYVVLRDGSVLAVSVADGVLAWQRDLGEGVSPPALVGDRLVVGTSANEFFGLQAASGGISWRWRVGGDAVGGGGSGDLVAFAALDNVLRAVERGTGNQRWKETLPGRLAFPPEVVGDLVLVTGSSPTVRAFDLRDGTLVGSYTAPAELAGPLLVPPGGGSVRMVAITRDGRLVGLRQKPAAAPDGPVDGGRGRGVAPPSREAPTLPPAPTTPGRPPTI